MKEILLAILGVFFPTVEYSSDSAGYCPCEFECAWRTDDACFLKHHSQGTYACSEEAYEFFSARTASPFADTGHQREFHTSKIHKWRYSWWPTPTHMTLSDEKDGLSITGCWNRGGQ